MVVKNTVKHAVGPTCADCGVDSGVAALIWRYGAWYCLDETACAERVFLVSGGADLVQRAQALQATRPAPSAPIWPDDEAAHVAETVDELHAPAFRISADNIADAIEREAEAVESDDEEEAVDETCDYCGVPGHRIDRCPVFDRDREEACALDAAADKSEWPL